ncbi:group II intron-encoded protein ltrA [Dorcoceras hygrometricum]|uniref:Group II intron-encoded protein ltrA n=1 Tax=Dorcoceras hygrometricum TaxID=472368 RepID=A0A2Z6ZSK9_9LAMI|nr:group II intron-encoded protein ltrA [Dorcoceras hygrometricum]
MREDRPCKARLSRNAVGCLALPRAWIGDGPGAASRELSRTAAAASTIARWSTHLDAGRPLPLAVRPPHKKRSRRRCWSSVRRRTLAAQCEIAPLLSRAKSVGGGAATGRPPLRRCRDGWSEFF